MSARPRGEARGRRAFAGAAWRWDQPRAGYGACQRPRHPTAAVTGGVEAAEEARVAKDVDSVVEPVVVEIIVGGEIRRIVDDVDGRARLWLNEGLLDDVLVPLLALGVDLEGIRNGDGGGQDSELGGGGDNFHVWQ